LIWSWDADAGSALSRLIRGVAGVVPRPLSKRWLLGTHQGRVDAEHIQAYLEEFCFRFNRRHSRARGLLFDYTRVSVRYGFDPRPSSTRRPQPNTRSDHQFQPAESLLGDPPEPTRRRFERLVPSDPASCRGPLSRACSHRGPRRAKSHEVVVRVRIDGVRPGCRLGAGLDSTAPAAGLATAPPRPWRAYAVLHLWTATA